MIINFIGDIILSNSQVNPFFKLEKFFNEDELTVGNLECVLKGSEGSLQNKSWTLSSRQEDLEYLKSITIDIVSLANNHVYDNLLDGFVKTINFLEQNNIKYLGAGVTKELAEAPLIIKKGGKQYGFLNYVTRDTNPGISKNSTVFVNWYESEKIKNDILLLKKKVDFVILLLHWGGKFEGGYYPDRYQYHDVKSFINTGTDLIIGHHSHTFQPFEKFNNKYAFYSLGNFLGTTNYTGGSRYSRRMNSAIVKIDFDAIDNVYKIIPINNTQGVLSLASLSNLKKIESRNRISTVLKKSVIAWYIYYINFKILEPFLFYFFGHNRNTFEKLKSLNLNKIKTYFKRIF